MAARTLGRIDGQTDIRANEGLWLFDDDDWALIAQLQDPISCAELLFEDPLNREYGGCYTVRDYQYPLFRPKSNYNIAPCGRETGKAQPLDAGILTPTGFRAMGDLAVGDEVIGGDGQPAPIVGIFPQGERPVWRVDFHDGSWTECDGDHLWQVTCDKDRSRGRGPRVLPLHELVQYPWRWHTPLVGPVEFRGGAVPLDPYLVGLLLGDGNLTRPTMVRYASVDAELVTAVMEALPDDCELVHDGGCDYRVRGRQLTYTEAAARGRGERYKWARHSLLGATEELALQGKAAHEKRVPECYRINSVEVRLATLQGLADTDGSVGRKGAVEIATASRDLADDIVFLVKSLGGRCTLRVGGTTHRDRYRVLYRLPAYVPPFRLARKLEAWRATESRKMHRDKRSIIGAKIVGVKPVQCIKVANADGLYVTDDFIVTHNTESIKARAVCHAFKRLGEDMLLTAPQMIHLTPLTQAVENRINSIRLTRDFLKRDNQKTGFVHNPFQCDFADGTRIIGRIPHLTGMGVKGQHVTDLLGDEMQDYPDSGWVEVFPTVLKDHTDATGQLDFSYTFYGVHAAGQGGRFGSLARSASYRVTTVTRLQTLGWGREEKAATAAMYGGTNSPDYRRNVLGEPGQALSQFFATARLMACMDQDPESRYNTAVFRAQELQAEEVDKMVAPGGDVGTLLDLPDTLGQQVYCGMDVGLVSDPTVIMIFAVLPDKQKRSRLQLIRMLHLWRFRERQIRQCTYRIARQYGLTLRAFGQDITGLGLPLYQAMEDDEECPERLKEASRGYVFNAKVPVSVDKDYVSQQGQQLVDQYGHMVEVVRDKWTGTESLVARMTMIEASTRYLRAFVDDTFLLLPFHEKLIADFQGETEQRVKAMAGVRKKPNAFHMLDAARAMAMAYKQGEVEEQVYAHNPKPVFDRAVYVPAY